MSNEILGYLEKNLRKSKGIMTANEISNQPVIWLETFNIINKRKTEMEEFLNRVLSKKDLKIIFTGAGTSGFVGETVTPMLNKKLTQEVVAIPTTDIVSCPNYYLEQSTPTLLISCARSGNSPESVATVNLAKEIVDDLYQIVLTCDPEGELAQLTNEGEKNKLILMPEMANDQGFAMTGSYTSMVLSSLLLFDLDNLEENGHIVNTLSNNANKIIRDNISLLKDITTHDFDRIVYIGSGCLHGVAKESALKMLELTAGFIVACENTPLGFRHGPKSIVNDKTLLIFYLSNDEYSRKYEYDLIKEVWMQDGEHKIFAISDYEDNNIKEMSHFYTYINKTRQSYKDEFLTFNYVINAQILGLLKSLSLKITPDNPSPDGYVNRVVKGVEIHPYNK
ncbi:SIS domain-containing protein [Sporosalibacterium faouarense]|uniref:SIS domain-containing protein n=1 Tax=Sporosalibacterium faouarense TaxID=516123 RepID=UPI00192ACFBB|nr:SIS domain-containing protein [Sporosalibacterium faouarense]